jgi:hypothetical protein
MEDIKYPNCEKCHAVIDIWRNSLVIDAYQKDGHNHYTFFCPHCGNKQKLSIPIQED